MKSRVDDSNTNEEETQWVRKTRIEALVHAVIGSCLAGIASCSTPGIMVGIGVFFSVLALFFALTAYMRTC